MRLAELIATTTALAALLALAQEIAVFYPQLALRRPTAHEEMLLDAARIYAHAAGYGGIAGIRALLKAVDALDIDRIHAAALLDRVWSGVPVAPEPEVPQADATQWIDAAMERGLRPAVPPEAWWKLRY